MAYDLQEQEQIDNLRAFWARYGNFILTVLTVVLLAVAGYRGWGWYQAREAVAASAVYDELRVAVNAKEPAKARQAADTLRDKHASTVYAAMGGLLEAQAHAQSGDNAAARAALQWVVDKDKGEFGQLARIRLAGLLLDDKAYDQALALLPTDSAGAFAAAYADRRGDILLAQGKTDEARAAWRTALEGLELRSALRPLVQLKLDALGGTGA